MCKLPDVYSSSSQLRDTYCFRLCTALKTGSLTEEINARHFSDLSVDLDNCIRQFNWLWVLKELYLLLIREVHDQVASGHPGR